MIKKFFALAFSSSLLITAMPAHANNAPFEPRLTTTITETVSGSGSGRTVTYTATASDSQGELAYSSPPSGSQVRVMGLVVFMCSAPQPASSVGFNPPSGCTNFSGTSSSNSGDNNSRTFVRSYAGSNFDANIGSYPYIVPTLHFTDAQGNELAIHGNATGSAPVIVPTSAPQKYSGPEILELPEATGLRGGSSLVFKGKKLDTITSATIEGKVAKHSYDAAKGLSIETPADLKPGTYDLVLQSPYGKLTHINAIKISPPVELISMSLRGSGSKIDARLATDLSNLSLMFGSDFKKVTCVVNASDAAVAEALAAHVCKYAKSGDLRSAAVNSKAKSTFKGEGFWVRVYLAG